MQDQLSLTFSALADPTRRAMLALFAHPVLAIAQGAHLLRDLRAEGGAVLTHDQVRALLEGAQVSGVLPSTGRGTSLRYAADMTARGSAMSSRGAHMKAWAKWSVAGDGRLMLNLQIANGAVWSASMYVATKDSVIYFFESLDDAAGLFVQEIKR